MILLEQRPTLVDRNKSANEIVTLSSQQWPATILREVQVRTDCQDVSVLFPDLELTIR
jgi:hypothetical protein